MASITRGFIKVEGQLKEARNAWAKVGGMFRKILTISEKRGGEWQEAWLPNAPVPAGTIVAWAGTAEEIPSGWFLCDGLNGTPNLVDRFVMGGNSPGETGSGLHVHGSSTSTGEHTHTLTATTHKHAANASQYGDFQYDRYQYHTTYDGSHSHTSSSAGTHSHTLGAASGEPAYYQLAYIQRGA